MAPKRESHARERERESTHTRVRRGGVCLLYRGTRMIWKGRGSRVTSCHSAVPSTTVLVGYACAQRVSVVAERRRPLPEIEADMRQRSMLIDQQDEQRAGQVRSCLLLLIWNVLCSPTAYCRSKCPIRNCRLASRKSMSITNRVSTFPVEHKYLFSRSLVLLRSQ